MYRDTPKIQYDIEVIGLSPAQALRMDRARREILRSHPGGKARAINFLK